MSFDVGADAYGQFMGRYSEPLAVQFAELAGVGAGQRVLDVGSGPGALTAEPAWPVSARVTWPSSSRRPASAGRRPPR
jgi:hypothetical protein